jgi:DNA-binding LacI/PurR family transcriptional regulator
MAVKTPNNVTIEDVAESAGVSAMTVSRYLNNTGPVSTTTAGRIQSAIQTLNYIPHQGARALAGQKTSTIGLIVPQMNDVFFFQLINGIQQVVADNQYDLLLYSSTKPGGVDLLTMPLGKHNADGLIVFADTLGESELRRLHEAQFPLVLLYRSPPAGLDIPTVAFENKDGAYQMVTHLIACGHRRIAFLAGAPENEDAHWREAGYRQALADQAIEYAPDLVAPAYFDEEIAAEIVDQWLADGRAIDAIFAADDVSARGAIAALQRAGRRVPDEMAVAGFDDALLSRYSDPPLTTVRAPIEEAGRVAAEQLLRLIHDEPAELLTLLPTELIIRESCGYGLHRERRRDRSKEGSIA